MKHNWIGAALPAVTCGLPVCSPALAQHGHTHVGQRGHHHHSHQALNQELIDIRVELMSAYRDQLGLLAENGGLAEEISREGDGRRAPLGPRQRLIIALLESAHIFVDAPALEAAGEPLRVAHLRAEVLETIRFLLEHDLFPPESHPIALDLYMSAEGDELRDLLAPIVFESQSVESMVWKVPIVVHLDPSVIDDNVATHTTWVHRSDHVYRNAAVLAFSGDPRAAAVLGQVEGHFLLEMQRYPESSAPRTQHLHVSAMLELVTAQTQAEFVDWVCGQVRQNRQDRVAWGIKTLRARGWDDDSAYEKIVDVLDQVISDDRAELLSGYPAGGSDIMSRQELSDFPLGRRLSLIRIIAERYRQMPAEWLGKLDQE